MDKEAWHSEIHGVAKSQTKPKQLSSSSTNRPSCPSPTPVVHSDSRPSSQWCHPAISSSLVPFSSCPQSFPASGSFPMALLFASDGQSIWSFSFSISSSNEYSGLISFRIDWFNLLAVQGTLKSILQHHGSKASILLWSAFFIVQLWHPWLLVKPSLWLDEPVSAK